MKEVQELIGDWLPTLKAPPLMVQKGIFGWEGVYSPTAEQDDDGNHMLRRHLKSRAFWSHHANWQLKLNTIWKLTNQLRIDTKNEYQERYGNIKHTPDYYAVALWKGFDVAFGLEIDDWYKIPDDKIGVSYGAYKIEVSATNENERSQVEKDHRQYISQIANNIGMMRLVELWQEVTTLQDQMYSIGNRALKSSDILYPCRFCRHLWQ